MRCKHGIEAVGAWLSFWVARCDEISLADQSHCTNERMARSSTLLAEIPVPANKGGPQRGVDIGVFVRIRLVLQMTLWRNGTFLTLKPWRVSGILWPVAYRYFTIQAPSKINFLSLSCDLAFRRNLRRGCFY